MELVQANQVFSVSYGAFDQSDDLDVGFYVYDVSTGSPVFVEIIAGESAGFGAYTSTYTAASGQTFLIIGAVFTDDTYVTLDPIYSPDAQCFQAPESSVVTFLAFNYATFDADPNLFIQASIYSLSSGSPVLVDTYELELAGLGAYFGFFDGDQGNTYVVTSVVYTDDTYMEVNTARAPAVDSFDCITAGVTNVLCEAELIGQSTEAILEGNCA